MSRTKKTVARSPKTTVVKTHVVVPRPSDASFRDACISALLTKYTPQEAEEMEAMFHKLGNEQYTYQKIGELVICPAKKDEILRDMDQMASLFDSCVYADIRAKHSKDITTIIEGPKIVEGSFQCKNFKCKSFECTYTQDQTRSADEGYTTKVTCRKCGFQYTFH